jgi:hypothetical protein
VAEAVVVTPAAVMVVMPPMAVMAIHRLSAGRSGQHANRQGGGDDLSHLRSPYRPLAADAMMVMVPAVAMVAMEHRLSADRAGQQRNRQSGGENPGHFKSPKGIGALLRSGPGAPGHLTIC